MKESMMDRQVRTVNGPKKEAFFFGKWRNQIMQPTVYTNLWITSTFIIQLLLHTSGFLAIIRLTA
jgi:hypothetical protein